MKHILFILAFCAGGEISYAQNIVINEIMADVNPAPNNLPAYEYIELYNRSNSPILLHKWTISDASSTATIPDITIQADSFYVLTSTKAASTFDSAVQVTSVPSFPSLNDASDNLTLKDSAGNVVSSVFYTNAWYDDSNKDGGGWSLEQIDPSTICAGKENWKASKDNRGGTPGKRNSVNDVLSDETAPFITNCTVVDSIHIQVFFSEKADSITLTDLKNYSIDNGIQNPVAVKAIAPEYKSLLLTLGKPIEENIVYTLQIEELKDCKGNTTSSEIKFGKALPAKEKDILINEIMFDPKQNGVEWIEIYNASDKMIDLKEISFCSYDEDGIFSDINSISNESYLFFPKSYLVLSKDDSAIKNQYISNNSDGFVNMKSIPSLNNDGDWVVIINAAQEVIDKVNYLPDWHLSLLNDTKGISLERISFANPSQDKSNWHSAAESCGFATPAYKNSQFLNGATSNEINVSPSVFSPNNDGYNDVLTISYSFNHAGLIGNVKVLDANGALVKNLVRNELLASSGNFFWDGYTDSKMKAGIGIYILYIEVFDTKGMVKKYKRVCTLGGNL